MLDGAKALPESMLASHNAAKGITNCFGSLVVSMHADTRERGVRILRHEAEVLDVLFVPARVYCDNNSPHPQVGLNYN